MECCASEMRLIERLRLSYKVCDLPVSKSVTHCGNVGQEGVCGEDLCGRKVYIERTWIG